MVSTKIEKEDYLDIEIHIFKGQRFLTQENTESDQFEIFKEK